MTTVRTRSLGRSPFQCRRCLLAKLCPPLLSFACGANPTATFEMQPYGECTIFGSTVVSTVTHSDTNGRCGFERKAESWRRVIRDSSREPHWTTSVRTRRFGLLLATMSGGTWRITAGDSAAGYVDVQPQISHETAIHSWISAKGPFGRQWQYARMMVAFAD